MMLLTQLQLPHGYVHQQSFAWTSALESDKQESHWYNGREWIIIPASQKGQMEMFVDPCVDMAAIFKHRIEEWHDERGASSSINEILLSPAYGSIIGLGQRAVPLILSRLETEGDNPDHWFYALQVLTGVNPVTEDNEGDLTAMAQAWLDWGRKHYIW